MITNPDLARLAEQMGVRLTRHDGGNKGYYDDATRTISTRRGLSIAQYRSTLAHELGHAHYRDIRVRDPVRHARQEQRADRWAANLLINPAEAKTVLYCYPHLEPAAYELEVTKNLLQVWVENNQHLLDHTG